MSTPRIAIAHDYLSTPGGAERVIEVLAAAFPDAPIYTSVFVPELYPTIDPARVHTSWLNRSGFLRRHYRAALPLLPSAFRQLRVSKHDADVVLCSSSGWAHAIKAESPKIVYCHNPARWLYQPDDYFSGRPLLHGAMMPLLPWLRRFDQSAAHSCAHYFGNSSAVVARIQAAYHRKAEVLWPPTSFDPAAEQQPIEHLPASFFLSVSRLLPYKRVGAVVQAMNLLPNEHLVVVGDGPDAATLRASAPTNVTFLGQVTDAQLRWLYHHATALVSAASEDFGLTPVEAALCGTPSVLLRSGGFLDTCIEGVNGVFFDEPTPACIAEALQRCQTAELSHQAIAASAKRFSAETFVQRITETASTLLQPGA